MLTLALAPGALAANEVGDAGDLRVTANDMGDTAVAEISGTLLDCARVHATEGEIVQSLQQVFGTYTETPVF